MLGPVCAHALDVANIHKPVRNENKFTCWRRITRYIEKAVDMPRGSATHKFAFVGVPPMQLSDDEDNAFGHTRRSLLRLTRWFHHNGITVFDHRPVVTHCRGGFHFDCNVDETMISRSHELAAELKVDEFVLVSGDDDFAPMCEDFRAQGIFVTAVSFDQSIGRLARSVDRVISLDPVLDFLPPLLPRGLRV